MLFTTVLLALAAAGPVFSAPMPSTGLTRRQKSMEAIERLHDALSAGAPHQRSKRLVPWQFPESVQRRATFFPSSAPPIPSSAPFLPSSAPPLPSSAPAEDEAPAEDAEDPAEGVEDPAEDVEDPSEDVEESAEGFDESAGDDGGEGTSTIPDLLPRH